MLSCSNKVAFEPEIWREVGVGYGAVSGGGVQAVQRP